MLKRFRRKKRLVTALTVKPDAADALTVKEAYLGEHGSTLRLEGRLQEALANQMEARQVALIAAEIKPANHTRRQAAFKLLSRCETLRKLKRFPEALQDGNDALAELKAIAVQDPANDQAKADLSLAYVRVGDVESSQGRIQDAVRNHGEALQFRQEQYTRHSSNPQAQRNYQASLTRFAEVVAASRQDRAAEGGFDRAIALGRRLQEQAPSDVYAAADLARAYRGKAGFALRRGDRSHGTELLRQSVELWRDLHKRCPLDVELAASAEESERALTALATR